MKKQTFIITIIVSLLSINSYAIELENNRTIENNLTAIPDIEVNIGNCIGCHGDNFEKPAMGMSQIVKDMTKEYIEATLFNYKYNSTNGKMDALMAWQTAKLTDDEIRAIAEAVGK